MSRFPKVVFSQGSEPDARFSLANERTFLAWIRTALALLAGGVALEALGLGIQSGYRLTASILAILAGVLSAVQAWTGWKRVEHALRTGSPLPSAPFSLPLAVLLVSVAVLVLLGILLR
ncbi:YidH family protein [Pseudarthrobacter sp. P1]|uniref:YidH family protein n=1 Tax=Pseudarthrobacter sp. P1 TaxID=3418418 RepID=UPI003CEE2A8A